MTLRLQQGNIFNSILPNSMNKLILASCNVIIVNCLVIFTSVTAPRLEFRVKVSAASPPNLVAGFPSLPVYPGAILAASVTDPNEGVTYVGTKYGATWQTSAPLPVLTGWYRSKLSPAGWTLDLPPADPNATDIQVMTFIRPPY